ncbi:MAG: Ig-like domain-containing protein [Clostridiales bacterium]|nr:Ig-like domain-containing protein [Clostridiales bacterium]
MKKALSVLLALLLLALAVPTLAEPEDYYIKVGGFTITSETTIPQVNAMFGAPKRQTPSAFGGSAYTYHDENYVNYLYLETNAAGKIVCYGSCDPSFETPYIKYGDPQGYHWSGTETGMITDRFNYNDIGCVYLYSATWQERGLYWSNTKRDPITYAEGLNQHIVIVLKLIAKANKYPENFAYDENLLLTNYQLYENGSDFYQYSRAVGRENFVKISGYSSNMFEEILNPLSLSWRWLTYSFTANHTYPAFILDGESPGKSSHTVYMVDPAILIPPLGVEYTDGEQERLAAMRAEYADSVRLWNNAYVEGGNSMFTVQPQWEELPLVAGAGKQGCLAGATAYLNTVRVGAGIPKLTHDPDLSDKAQHKAVLSMYSTNVLGIDGGHYPPQPEGVSDEFYLKSQPAAGENLYNGNLLTSISNALQEAYGDIIACGHRYNLLTPSFQYFGVGCHTEGAFSIHTQGVHQLSGNQAHDITMLAWPSAGVTPMEIYKDAYWTARFLKDYTFTDDTVVEVKHLNSDKTWTFDKEQNTASRKFYRLGTYQVTFYDASIAVEAGDVFEITLKDVKNKAGDPVDYTYRSVFENAYRTIDGAVTGLTLSKSALTLREGDREKLKATIAPAGAENKMVRWSSSDETVATVDAYGRVTGHIAGAAVITATTEDGALVASCAVTVRELSRERGDANCDWLVNAADAAAILRYLVELQTLLPQGLLNAKVTSGTAPVSAADAAKILRYLVDLETTL